MPQVTVYIREDDLAAWKGIAKKSEWLHNALNGVDEPPARVEKELHAALLKEKPRKSQGVMATSGELKIAPMDKLLNIPGVGRASELRTTGSVLAEIKQLELQRDGELEYCQDSGEAARIGKEYGSKIQALWDEYHLLKEA